jgi:hypothetical protein
MRSSVSSAKRSSASRWAVRFVAASEHHSDGNARERRHTGRAHGAAKTVMQRTGASERTVRSWFAGTKGPSSEHLITLARHSDSVFLTFVRVCRREQQLSRDGLVELRKLLAQAMHSLDDASAGLNQAKA